MIFSARIVFTRPFFMEAFIAAAWGIRKQRNA
jgi:hypothetical protein